MIYEENHSFDNLYGGWGKVGGRRSTGGRRPARRTPAGRPGRHAYGCLMQNDVNLTVGPLAGTCGTETVPQPTGPRSLHQPLRQQAVPDRQLHQADRHHLPADRQPVRLPQRRAQGARAHPAAAPATSCTSSTRSSTSSTAAREPLRHGQRRGRPDDGLLRHQAAADLPLPARQEGAALRHRRPLLPGARSVAPTSTTST